MRSHGAADTGSSDEYGTQRCRWIIIQASDPERPRDDWRLDVSCLPLSCFRAARDSWISLSTKLRCWLDTNSRGVQSQMEGTPISGWQDDFQFHSHSVLRQVISNKDLQAEKRKLHPRVAKTGKWYRAHEKKCKDASCAVWCKGEMHNRSLSVNSHENMIWMDQIQFSDKAITPGVDARVQCYA